MLPGTGRPFAASGEQLPIDTATGTLDWQQETTRLGGIYD
jgi:hypothetical protein